MRITTFNNLILRLSAFVAASTLLGGTMWAAGDYTGLRPVIKRELLQVQQTLDTNNQTILLMQFQLLMQKRQYGGLTFEEQQRLCSISRALGYVGVPGC